MRELDEIKQNSQKHSSMLVDSVKRAKEQLQEDEIKEIELTQRNKSVSSKLGEARDELWNVKTELRKAKLTVTSQKTKLEKLEAENDLFRKFYARNLGDERQEQTAEIELVYKDLNKAFNLKDNFINRGM